SGESEPITAVLEAAIAVVAFANPETVIPSEVGPVTVVRNTATTGVLLLLLGFHFGGALLLLLCALFLRLCVLVFLLCRLLRLRFFLSWLVFLFLLFVLLLLCVHGSREGQR